MAYEQPLAFRVKSLHNQIRRLFESTAIAENNARLTGMQYAILGFLSEQDSAGQDVYQRDIEAEFNIRPSTASGMLRLLENDGYISRENVPDDARLKKIIRTDIARELDKAAKSNMNKIEAKLTGGITKNELEQFYCVLKKITDNAKRG